MIERAQRIIPDCRTYLLKGRGHLTLVYGDKEDTRYVFDVAKMKADIENRITVK